MLWSSSLPDTSSSFAVPRSSFARSCSSMTLCRYSFAAASSSSSFGTRARSNVVSGAGCGALPRRQRMLLEEHDVQNPEPLRGALQRDHHDIADPLEAVLVDLDAGGPRRDRPPPRLRHRRAKRHAQPLPRHLHQVVLRLARRRLEVRPRLPAKLQDRHLVVDHDAWRRVAGQQQPIDPGRQVDRSRRLARPARTGGERGALDLGAPRESQGARRRAAGRRSCGSCRPHRRAACTR
jgi:hypothetical protein